MDWLENILSHPFCSSLLGRMDGVDIEVTLANQFVINALVFSDPLNQPWMMTIVHAPYNRSSRSIFWDQLNTIGSSFRGLWLCAWDFNCILSQSEKKGGKRVGDLTRSELKSFLDSGELIDLGFKGNSFTWTNKRMGKANIKERLNRAVTNVDWRSLCPKATVKHLPLIASDHAPLLINTHEKDLSGPKPFRFKEAWTRDDSSSMVIKKAWNFHNTGNPQFLLAARIKQVKINLKWWNMNVFGLIQKRLSSLPRLSKFRGWIQMK
jgi:hypothetical protein